jgi:hypothetical protein
VAAIAWSWSLWVVHFGLYERETWAALGAALALGACWGGPLGWRRAGLVAGALLLGVCMKLTAGLVAVGLLAHLLVRGRLAELLRVGLLFGLGLAAVTLVCWLRWGEPFLVQVFLFGFFRNGTDQTFGFALSTLLAWSDPITLLGLGALLAVGLPRLRRPEGAAALVLLAELTYLVAANPVSRNHNMISLVPASALLGAVMLVQWRRTWRRALLATGAVVVALLVHGHGYMPGTYGPWGPGYGGDARADLERHAEFLRRHSAPDEIVATVQPWWAVLAQRVEFVRYLDLQSMTMGIRASLDADGLAATWAKRQGPYVLGPGYPPAEARLVAAAEAGQLSQYAARIAACALVHLRPLMLEALAAREIALVLEPTGILTERQLLDAGYVRFVDEELGIAAWRPADGVSHPRVRAIHPR